MTTDKTMAILFFVSLMILINFVYTIKIALEMNLGFSTLTNTIEFCHIFVVEIALIGYIYSTVTKRDFELDILDRGTFVDMSLFNMVDKYCRVALNMAMIFYPFRFFAFISRFGFSTAIKGMLNVIVRMSPGLFTYFTIVLIISICISVSSMLLLGPIIPEMHSFWGAYFMTLTANFFDNPQFRELVFAPNQQYYPLIVFAFQQMMNFSMVVFIALTVYLFTKAAQYEKDFSNDSENEEPDFIEEIHEKVN